MILCTSKVCNLQNPILNFAASLLRKDLSLQKFAGSSFGEDLQIFCDKVTLRHSPLLVRHCPGCLTHLQGVLGGDHLWLISDVYEGWKSDPEAFWMEAAKGIDWVQPPTKALFDDNAPLV